MFAALLFSLDAGADVSRPGEVEPPDSEATAWAFKLTPSYYSTSNQHAAVDINLRANQGPHALWLGYYQRGSEFEQLRTGYEMTLAFDYAKLVPSLQLATHGFAGCSINLELGSVVYALLGLGRTNARDYYNLNFDPNDSVVYGLGTRLLPNTNLSLYTVRDNRLHTGQVVTHAVLRYQFDTQHRLIVDLFDKHGREAPGDPEVTGRGVSVTYDFRDVFVRMARDQKVNFTPDDQTRISLGLRF